MKTLVLATLAFTLSSSSVVAQTLWQCQLQTHQPQTLTSNPTPPLVVIYVDFPDGRLPNGGPPTQDSDTASVANIDAVGSMGYRSGQGGKQIRKYVYEDYWNMIFSSNTYTCNVHPDYSTHNTFSPPEGGGPYLLTVYGSVYDYWNEVS
jgi:hypothetical protein